MGDLPASVGSAIASPFCVTVRAQAMRKERFGVCEKMQELRGELRAASGNRGLLCKEMQLELEATIGGTLNWPEEDHCISCGGDWMKWLVRGSSSLEDVSLGPEQSYHTAQEVIQGPPR